MLYAAGFDKTIKMIDSTNMEGKEVERYEAGVNIQ
jgi:hypothetical protein